MGRLIIATAVAVVVLSAPASAARVSYFTTPNKRAFCEAGLPRQDHLFCVLYVVGGRGPSWPTVSLARHGRASTKRLVGNGATDGLKVKRYGESFSIVGGKTVPVAVDGYIQCSSRRTGLTCTNADGHGFRFKSRGISTF